jgi:ribulose-phosphate 3-epimerase
MNPTCAPVDLGRLHLARKLWSGVPLCLHVMSLYPTRWLASTWNSVDWYLFHVNARENLFHLMAECRLRRKKVGVVWHGSASLEELLPYLPHVDFVMVLGIANPGRSGQPIDEGALAVADLLDELRPRYGYEVMFDGSVNLSTIGRIRAKYIVAASAVLRATDPIRSVNSLKSSAKYERRVA